MLIANNNCTQILIAILVQFVRLIFLIFFSLLSLFIFVLNAFRSRCSRIILSIHCSYLRFKLLYYTILCVIISSLYSRFQSTYTINY